MTRGYTFRPRRAITAAAATFVAATLSLSAWQFDRAEQKRALKERYLNLQERPAARLASVDFGEDPERLRYLRVFAHGAYGPRESLLVDNRMSGRRPGYWVLSAFHPENGEAPPILVVRGWVPGGADRSQIPKPPSPSAGTIDLSGVLIPDSSDVLELSDTTVAGNVWQNAKAVAMGDALGLELAPMLLVSDVPIEGLEPVAVKPDFKVLNSVSYAFQWLAFALLGAGLYVGLNLKRAR